GLALEDAPELGDRRLLCTHLDPPRRDLSFSDARPRWFRYNFPKKSSAATIGRAQPARLVAIASVCYGPAHLDSRSPSGGARGHMEASPGKDASPCAVGFIGDLDDPWVAAIADAIATSRPVDRRDLAGPLPAWPFDGADPPRAAVIHRHQLGPADARRL